MRYAYIKDIEYYLPEKELTNEELAKEYPEWSVEKIKNKTGISKRHIANENECSSDLAVQAAQKIFSNGIIVPSDIDYLIFCTQSPDYFLPTTACIIQDRLGLKKDCGATDFNLGCSGYIYGLGLAKGLIETDQAKNVLLLTGETYSKFIHPKDKSVRTIFGDGATATVLTSAEDSRPYIGPFSYGTDGSGFQKLIVPAGGLRLPRSNQTSIIETDEEGNTRTKENIFMNGPDIFTFTINVVPKTVDKILSYANKTLLEIDLFIFHQASKFMLDHLQKKIGIPKEKFYLSFENYGNTVSSTIPIALKDALKEGRIRSGMLILIVGFGVGLSWGGTIIRWK